MRNGLDFLQSAVGHLDDWEGGQARDVKYAVLHLRAAVEVLLKARLHAEDWTLVFAPFVPPRKMTRENLESADFKSVTLAEAITRLRDIPHVTIDKTEEEELLALVRARNKLQHFGLTASATEVEERTAKVLDFLIRFCDEQLLPYLTNESELREAKESLESLREGLTRVTAYGDQRMERIGNDLRREGAENRTIECPECERAALVIGDSPADPPAEGPPVTATCRFCERTWSTEDLAFRYFGGRGRRPERPHACPQCGQATLGTGVVLRSSPRTRTVFCFTCLFPSPELGSCSDCGHVVSPAEDPSFSGRCERCRASGAPVYEGRQDYGFHDEAEDETP
ncbi:serine/arginine repetitive matrix protein 1 [Streptomyces sp. SPB074]|nr:serine/arginine repetitive matrix protein 1 [Streptomyces sp. SPB074]